MSKLQQIFRNSYEDFISSAHLSQHQINTANCILNCQTGTFGSTEINCEDCHHRITVMNGCGNRHCSGCQKSKGYIWAEKQKSKLLPGVSYFMVTFTIPFQAQKCFLQNQKCCYDALFKSGADTINTLLKDKKNIGSGHFGFFGVLHTGGRTMNYHPHVHFLVPSGGISSDYTKWKWGRDDYLFSKDAAIKMFRGKMMDALHNLLPLYPEIESYRNKGWNVNIEQKGSGEKPLEYLSRYLFKNMIAESNIHSWDDESVTILYKPKDEEKKKKLKLDVKEFLKRFFSLVLPNGFMKVRHFGFLSGSAKLTIDELKKLIWGDIMTLTEEKKQKPERTNLPRCSFCSSANIAMSFSPPPKRNEILIE